MSSELHLPELLAPLGLELHRGPAASGYLQALERFHRSGGSRASLGRLANATGDPFERSLWQGWSQAYQRFWRGRELQPFSPLSGRLELEGGALVLEPDLGLEVDGTPYSLYVHLGSASLLGEPARLICQAFSEGLDLDGGVRVAVLDLPRNLWLEPPVPSPDAAERLRVLWRAAVA
ncbi:MAG: hypothetical protein ACYS26_06860 [Planctomycetota bacterium]|jgi:hypothetical protein